MMKHLQKKNRTVNLGFKNLKKEKKNDGHACSLVFKAMKRLVSFQRHDEVTMVRK